MSTIQITIATLKVATVKIYIKDTVKIIVLRLMKDSNNLYVITKTIIDDGKTTMYRDVLITSHTYDDAAMLFDTVLESAQHE